MIRFILFITPLWLIVLFIEICFTFVAITCINENTDYGLVSGIVVIVIGIFLLYKMVDTTYNMWELEKKINN